MSVLLYKGVLYPKHHSWSIVGYQLLRALERLGYAVRLESTNGIKDIDTEFVSLLHTPGEAYIGMSYTIPPNIKKLATEKKILIYNYETTVLPAGWAKLMNEYADVILPASQFAKKIFLANGVRAEKMHILPHGIDLHIFKPNHQKRKNTKFRFLNVSSPHARKGLDLLIRAFAEEFASSEPVALDIKVGAIESRKQYYYVDPTIILKNVQQSFTTPEINIITDRYDDQRMAKLYNASHAYVSPTRSECFGITFLEAAACNVPIITTGYGGHMDFLNKDNAFLLRYNLIAAPRKCQYWHFSRRAQIAQPDYQQLKQMMRYVVTHYDIATSKSQEACKVVQQYTWEQATLQLVDILERQKWSRQFTLSKKSSIIVPLDFKSNVSTSIPRYDKTDKSLKKAILQKRRQLELIKQNKQRAEVKERAVRVQLEELEKQSVDKEQSRKKIIIQKSVATKPVKLLKTFSMSSFTLVLNEANHIRAMLSNIYMHFDEIIIVDGGSTDDTLKIIQSFQTERQDNKIKVFVCPQKVPRYSTQWKQSEQRDFALEQCTKQWVFMIDADERLDRNFRSQVHALISTRKENWYAFAKYHYWQSLSRIRVDSYWYPNYSYRLWKNQLGIKYESKARHCQPMIPSHIDVLNCRTMQDDGVFTTIPIHHLKYLQIQTYNGMYRANQQDVKSLRELKKGLQLQSVETFNDRMQILYHMENFNRYSGGRYHLWGIAAIMDNMNMDVTMVSNRDSLYKTDFPVSSRFCLDIKPNFVSQASGPFNLVVATHNYCGPIALQQARRHKAKLLAIVIDIPTLIQQARGGLDSTEAYWSEFKATLPHADLIFVSTELASKELVKWCPNIAAEKIMVVSPPINSNCINTVSFGTEYNEIAIVGRFDVEHKHFEHLLKVFKSIDVKPLPIIHVIGAGKIGQYQDAAIQAGLTVHFHQNVTDKQKFEIMGRCKLGISCSTYEGFGMPPAEFMLLGKPYIAYDLAVTKDVYKDNIIYVKTGDMDDLTRKLTYTLNDDKFRKKIADKGRCFALDHFTWQHSQDRIKMAFIKLGLL